MGKASTRIGDRISRLQWTRGPCSLDFHALQLTVEDQQSLLDIQQQSLASS